MTAEVFQVGQLLRLAHDTLGETALVLRVTSRFLHVVTSKGSREALRKADVAPVQICGRLTLCSHLRTYHDQVWRDLEYINYEGDSSLLAYCAQPSMLSPKETRESEILRQVFFREWGEPTPPGLLG